MTADLAKESGSRTALEQLFRGAEPYPLDGYIRLWYIRSHDSTTAQRATSEARANALPALEANRHPLRDDLADGQGRGSAPQSGRAGSRL